MNKRMDDDDDYYEDDDYDDGSKRCRNNTQSAHTLMTAAVTQGSGITTKTINNL